MQQRIDRIHFLSPQRENICVMRLWNWDILDPVDDAIGVDR
jgi:hypothetical protein